MIKFIDLFAGVGGFHTALQREGAKCVASVEIDENARKTYNHLYGDCLMFNDIREVNPINLPDCDIMCGGFPCQAFSIAGYRKGFEDERGNLFFEIARLAESKRPKVLFLENVKNLTAHDNGNTFKVIIGKLEELGYFVKYKVLNSCEYGGVPQNRERIYIVAFREKSHYDKFEFPQPIKTKPLSEILEGGKVDDKYYYNGKPLYEKLKDEVTEKGVFYQWRRVYVRKNKSGVCPTLTANMGTGGHNVPIIVDDYGIRKLTPIECFRLQGFTNITLPKNVSDGQLYKQAGNAVTVGTVQRVFQKIKESITQ